jgi:hypothetical protein
MTQAYSDPTRENDPHSLPDIETFFVSEEEAAENRNKVNNEHESDEGMILSSGWCWWPCFPGCLPDSDPQGPFDTEEEALEDARIVEVDRLGYF